MALLKDSANQEVIKEQYDQLWVEFQHIHEKKVKRILDQANNRLVPKKERFLQALSPFKTHLTWIIPLSVIAIFILLYVLFIWVALLVE